MTIGVQQNDRGAPEARRVGGLEIGAEAPLVERLEHVAAGADPLARRDDARVEHLGQLDLQREDVGALLAADPDRVLEPGGDHEHRRLAAALEQCVRRDRRAHLDRGDRALGGRRAREHAVDRRDRGVRVAARILR